MRFLLLALFLLGCRAGVDSYPIEYDSQPTKWGVMPGDTLPDWYAWPGYSEYSLTADEIPSWHYADPWQEFGVEAIFFVTSSWNCPACMVQLDEVNQKMLDGWYEQGVRVIVLLYRNIAYSDPDLEDALALKLLHDLDVMTVVADPDGTLFPPLDPAVVPWGTIVDPVTMTVTCMRRGYTKDHYPCIENLLNSR